MVASVPSISAGPLLAAEDNSLAVAANSAYKVDDTQLEKDDSDITVDPLSSTRPDPPDTKADNTTIPEAPVSLEAQPTQVQSPLPPSNNDPAIKQPVSDVRQPTEPVSTDVASEIKESKERQDLAADSSLANGLAQGGDIPIERSLASNKASPAGDLMQIDEPPGPDVQSSIDNPSVVPETDNNTSLPLHPPGPTSDEQLPDVAPNTPQPSTEEVHSSIEASATPLVSQPEIRKPEAEEPVSVPTKISHPRDDETTESEPASKRVKADNDSQVIPEFRVPDPPAQHILPDVPAVSTTAVAEGSAVSAPSTASVSVATAALPTQNGKALLPRPAKRESNPSFDLPMTRPQQKHLQRGLTNIKKSAHADNFLNPVDPVRLNIPRYPDVVKNPMDLRTMNQKLKEDKYGTVKDFIEDFDQMVENTALFNGQDHDVTQHAFHLRIAFDRSLSTIPSHEYTEPTAEEKKAKKATIIKPPPRRESRSSVGNARSPTASSPQTTFALGPSGVPLIRRDSTVADGRPKREIHPPAPKDLPYSASKPKRKKYQSELKFCREVLNELKKPKYDHISHPFQQPVDPVSLNIPQYHKMIKRPMDISSIHGKLETGQYENAKEFEADVRLMFQNCYKFNQAEHPVHKMGKEYEKVFDEKWSTKSKWLNDHAPSSEAQSPGSFSEGEEDEEEDDEEPEEEEDDNEDEIANLQKSLMTISQQIASLKNKKKKSPPAATKKSKGTKATKKEPKKAQPKSNKKSTTKKTQSRAPIMSYDEKRSISDRINELPENKVPQVLQIIRDNMPSLKVKSINQPFTGSACRIYCVHANVM